jgi:hypothetical protein
LREYGNCGSGYIYNDHTPDLPRTGAEGAPRPRALRPSPLALLDNSPVVVSRPRRTSAPKTRYPGRGPTPTSPELAAEIARRYRAGESTRAIRADLGIGYDRVTAALRDHGIEPTKARRRPGQDWPCSECKRQMKPWNADSELWPEGAVAHAGHGRCVNCKAREAKRLARETAAK